MSDLDPTSQLNPALAGSAEIADRVNTTSGDEQSGSDGSVWSSLGGLNFVVPDKFF